MGTDMGSISLVHVDSVTGGNVNITINLVSPDPTPQFAPQTINVCNHVNTTSFTAVVKVSSDFYRNITGSGGVLGKAEATKAANNSVVDLAKQGSIDNANDLASKFRQSLRCGPTSCQKMIFITSPEDPIIDGPHVEEHWYGDYSWAQGTDTVDVYYACYGNMDQYRACMAEIEKLMANKQAAVNEFHDNLKKIQDLKVISLGNKEKLPSRSE